MHGPNAVLREARLRDGRPAIEFLRANPYFGGVEFAATSDGIAEVLTQRTLDRLVEREGIAVLYTHLGKIRSAAAPFGPANATTCQRFTDRVPERLPLDATRIATRVIVAAQRAVLAARAGGVLARGGTMSGYVSAGARSTFTVMARPRRRRVRTRVRAVP